jgi:hypothetical protein
MPTRSHTLIRQDINRLNAVIRLHQELHPPLNLIAPVVDKAARQVNKTWRHYHGLITANMKVMDLKDSPLLTLLGWIHRWRPAIQILVPGAEIRLRKLSSRKWTIHDLIWLAEDMRMLIESAGNGLEVALDDFGEGLAISKQVLQVSVSFPDETEAFESYTKACLEANNILLRGTQIIRAIFGRTSPEYKSFVDYYSEENGIFETGYSVLTD